MDFGAYTSDGNHLNVFSPERYLQYHPKKQDLSFYHICSPDGDHLKLKSFINTLHQNKHFFQKNQKCPRGHDGWQICLCCRKKPIPCLEGSKVTPPTLWRQGLVLLLNLNQICHPSWPRRHLSLFCKIACFGEEYLWNTSTLNGHHLGYRHARRLRFFLFGQFWTYLSGEKTIGGFPTLI